MSLYYYLHSSQRVHDVRDRVRVCARSHDVRHVWRCTAKSGRIPQTLSLTQRLLTRKTPENVDKCCIHIISSIPGSPMVTVSVVFNFAGSDRVPEYDLCTYQILALNVQA